MNATSPDTAVPESQQRETLLALSVKCGACAEHFAVAAQIAVDFELRAFLSNCSRIRNSMADDLFLAGSKLPDEGTAPERAANVPRTQVPAPNVTPAEDALLLAGCLSQEETLVDELRKALELPLSPEPDAIARKCFADVVATCERIKSLEQSM